MRSLWVALFTFCWLFYWRYCLFHPCHHFSDFFSLDTVDVETLFCFLPRRGTWNTSFSSAIESNPVLIVLRLLSKTRIMTHNINNTNDHGSNPSWENHWEQPGAYISVPDPLNHIATIFMRSFQMNLSLDLKLPSSLLHFLYIKLKEKTNK